MSYVVLEVRLISNLRIWIVLMRYRNGFFKVFKANYLNVPFTDFFKRTEQRS